MKFETFKAGRWQQRYQYKSFEPVLVNHEWIWEDPVINTLLEAANRALGELNAFSLIVPDIDLFISMHVVKEAQTSSRIEGTQTGIDEALMPEEQILPEKRDDWREVRNYIDAVNLAIAELLNLLYRKPLISASDIEQAVGVSTPTANVLIRDFIQLGILVEITGQRRWRSYAFDRYLRLFVS